MANWALRCKACSYEPPEDQPMSVVQEHMIAEHDTDKVDLLLIPKCSYDGADLDVSASGDSGQCPSCGRFEFLRVPEEYRK